MVRGTTPTIVYNINSEINLNDMVQIWATFKSKTKEVTLDITKLEVDNDKKVVIARLSQEETLQFHDESVETQLRLLSGDGKAYASLPKRLKVNNILKGGVIHE